MHEHRIGLARQALVVLEASLAGQQPHILEPPHGLADSNFIIVILRS